MNKITRRRFVNNTLAAGTVLAFPHLFIRKARAALAPKTQIHPNVDILRVAGITDARMTTAVESQTTWVRQNELVNTQIVQENLDRLACALCKSKNEKEAWQTIFVKPPAKSWSDAVVAIKTNNIGRQQTRNAVMSKVCRVLTDIVGVKGPNIHIYDACHGRDMSVKTPYTDLPEGCVLQGNWGGMTTAVTVPAPWTGGTAKCVEPVAAGAIDIIVNIAMCKGHDRPHLGDFTMAVKNHLGTFEPLPAHDLEKGVDYLIAVNQSPEILGPRDEKSGRVAFPRQQLCIIDGLWASKMGPSCFSSDQPNFLAMSVFAPSLDYQVATKIRAERMGWTPNMATTKRFLSDFGYSEKDLPEGGKIIEPA